MGCQRRSSVIIGRIRYLCICGFRESNGTFFNAQAAWLGAGVKAAGDYSSSSSRQYGEHAHRRGTHLQNRLLGSSDCHGKAYRCDHGLFVRSGLPPIGRRDTQRAVDSASRGACATIGPSWRIDAAPGARCGHAMSQGVQPNSAPQGPYLQTYLGDGGFQAQWAHYRLSSQASSAG